MLFIALLSWLARLDASTVQAAANWAQIIGSISLPLALFGLYSAKRDLVSERRLAHELDILRELAGFIFLTIVPTGETDELRSAAKLRSLVRAIPGNTDLPLTRAALYANPSADGLAEFRRKFPNAPDEDSGTHRFMRFAEVWNATTGGFRSEVHAAIEARVTR